MNQLLQKTSLLVFLSESDCWVDLDLSTNSFKERNESSAARLTRIENSTFCCPNLAIPGLQEFGLYFFFWFVTGSAYYNYCYKGIIEEARVFGDRNRRIGFVFFYFSVLCYFLGFGRRERWGLTACVWLKLIYN